MLIQYFKKALKITNESFVIVLPLVTFYILLHLYLLLTGTNVDNAAKLFVALLTIIFMAAVFLSGWIFMIKKAVDLSKRVFVLDEDAVKAHLGLLKEFSTGVGKYFLSFLEQIILFILLFIGFSLLFHYTGSYFIGNINLTPEQITYFYSQAQNVNLPNSISPNEVTMLLKWISLFFVLSFIASYMVMFWSCEIVYTGKNPFNALFGAVKKLFRKPLKSFGLFVIINILNFILSVIITLTSKIMFLYFFFSVFYLYFIVYVLVVIFSYYDGEFGSADEEN